MFDERGRLVLKNYMEMPPFCKSLPGITGPSGLPMWCYYVNRGQGIAGFGSGKDAVLKYGGAVEAYRSVGRLGFRTFIKTGAGLLEPFAYGMPADLHIGLNELYIEQALEREGLKVQVLYYILPGEEFGALVRQITIHNSGNTEKRLEVLDGLAALTPCGEAFYSKEEELEFLSIFLKIERLGRGAAFFRYTGGGGRKEHFAAAFSGRGEALPVFTEPENLFGYDSAMTVAHRFKNHSLEELSSWEPKKGSHFPCCFFGKTAVLPSGRKVTLYELYGTTGDRESVHSLMRETKGKSWFGGKYGEAVRLAEKLAGRGAPRTGNGVFDFFSRQAWLTNTMQGGEPVLLGNRHIFYLYTAARPGCCGGVHPAFQPYSQAAGEYLHIMRSRKNNLLFTPFMEETAVRQYFEQIQINGLAAPVLKETRYGIPDRHVGTVQRLIRGDKGDDFTRLLTRPFTPGELYEGLKGFDLYEKNRLKGFEAIMLYAEEITGVGTEGEYRTGGFGEGLALLEDLLSIYPERKEALLFLDTTHTYPSAHMLLSPFHKRFSNTQEGIRQEYFLEKGPGEEGELLKDKNGHVLMDALIDKLIVLCTVKMTSLDPYAMGLLMECGNPGDNIFLDALPGQLGSSMKEACDLLRLVEFTAEALSERPGTRLILEEVGTLMRRVCKAIRDSQYELLNPGPAVRFWKRICDAREVFEEEIRDGLAGSRMAYGTEPLLQSLMLFQEILEKGVEKALYYGEGLCPSCFSYEITGIEKRDDYIFPVKLQICHPPCFLDGPAACMLLKRTREEKKELYAAVRNGGFYDEVSGRYLMNRPFEDRTQRVGRLDDCTTGFAGDGAICRAAGLYWLLGLLKAGLYKEFREDFEAVILNSEEEAPLFLELYRIMLFGERPFFLMEGELKLSLSPLLPSCLFGERSYIEAVFLDETAVIYHLFDKKDYFPGNYRVESVELYPGHIHIKGPVIGEGWAEKIRAGQISRIELRLVRTASAPEGRNPYLEGAAASGGIFYRDVAVMEKGQFPGDT